MVAIKYWPRNKPKQKGTPPCFEANTVAICDIELTPFVLRRKGAWGKSRRIQESSYND